MKSPVTVDYDNSRKLIQPHKGDLYDCTGYGIQFHGDISNYRDNFKQISEDIIGIPCGETLPDFTRTKTGTIFNVVFRGRSNQMPYILRYQNINHSEDVLQGDSNTPVDKYEFSVVLEKTAINGESILCVGQHSIPKSNTYFNDTYHFETHKIYEVSDIAKVVTSLTKTPNKIPHDYISRPLSSYYKPKIIDVIPDEIIAGAFRNESDKLLPVLL